MEEALRAYLLTQPALTDLIGERIFWGVRPQGTPLPALVLNRISQPGDHTYKARVRLCKARVQMDCLGASNASARGLERALLAVLDGKSFIQGGIEFQGCFAINARDLTSPGTTDADTIFRPSIDFNIIFKE